MRAILRIPRLCKLYHDKVKSDKMQEFQILEDIYEEHFKIYSDELKEMKNTAKKLTVAEETLMAKALNSENE